MRVVVAQIRQPTLQSIARAENDARIDFSNQLLFGTRILLFNDAIHVASFANDATVAGGIIHVDRQDGHIRRRRLGQQVGECFCRQQRHIASKNEDAVVIGRTGHGLLHRVTRAQLLCLQDPTHVRL